MSARSRHSVLVMFSVLAFAAPATAAADAGSAARARAAGERCSDADALPGPAAGDDLRDVTSWSVGENLAWGTGPLATPRATVRVWMHSPDHRANLLDRGFADVGIGVAAGAPITLDPRESGGTDVTDFGRRLRD